MDVAAVAAVVAELGSALFADFAVLDVEAPEDVL